jgi:hypothetical protein
MASLKLSALVPLGPNQVPTDLLYIDDVSAGAAGSKSITPNDLLSTITRNITDGAVRFQGFAAPALSAAGQGAIYFDSTANAFRVSENAGAYRAIGDVTGPAGVTANGIARYDSTSGKLIKDSIVTISDAGAFAFPDNVRQVFNPGATVAGLNVGALAGDPGTPINGDLWYDSTGNLLRARINGASISLGGVAIGGPVAGGTPGAVLFVGAGSVLAEDSAALFYDNTLNFLGLGTNAPILRLDIVGAVDGGIRLKQGGQLNGTSGAYGNGMIFENTSTIHSFAIGYSVGGNFRIFHLDNLGAITPVATFSTVASAVNDIVITSAATGNGPVISTAGTDANISLTFSPKGAGLNAFTKNLLFNVGSGALDNLIYVGAATAVAVNASFGFFVAGVGSDESSEGPYFLGRGNTFTALGNQRGSIFLAAGGAVTPTQNEGSINFFTNAPEQQRARIARAGSGLPLLALTQANTGETALSVDNPSGSTAPIATFSVNTVPFAVIDSTPNAYFGNGIVNAAPASYTLNGTGGSGTDVAGASWFLAGGKGTGVGAQGLAAFKYPLTTAAGTGLQVLSTASFPPWVNMFIRNDGDVVVSNTTAETSILGAAQGGSTKTIEAGLARVARVFLLRLWGSVTTTGTPTLQLRLKLNGVTVADIGAITMANNTASGGGGFYVEALITVRAVGATGVLHILPFKFAYNVTNGGAVNQATVPAAPTVDLTTAQTVDVTAQWSAASPSNLVNIGQALIDMTR